MLAAVSHRVRELEQSLRVALFVRKSRGVTLTEAGRRYRDALSDALARIERATANVQLDDVDGPLSLSVPESFAQAWLVPRLQNLFAALPGIELSVATSSALADIRGGDANLAIRFGAGGYDGVASERLLGDAVTVLVPAGEPAASLRKTTLLVDDGTTAGEPWMRWPAWLAEAGVDDSPQLRRAHFGTAALCVQASAASAGACVGRMSLAHELLRQRTLTALLPWLSTEYSYYLITRHGDADNPRVQAFRRWLREEIDRFCEAVQRAHGVTLGTPALDGIQAMS